MHHINNSMIEYNLSYRDLLMIEYEIEGIENAYG